MIIFEYKIIYVSLIIFLLMNINATVITNESEFSNLIKSQNTNELVINIDSKIDLTESYNITNSFQKISIIGKTKETCIINFSDLENYLSFNKGVNEIVLENISIIGNINFENNSKITMESVHINGNINSNFESKNNYVRINHLTYMANSLVGDECINLSGNIEIDHSEFYGNSSCLRLFNYNGLDIYNMSIKNSVFNGNYGCACLFLINGINVNIISSTFEKCYSIMDNIGG